MDRRVSSDLYPCLNSAFTGGGSNGVVLSRGRTGRTSLGSSSVTRVSSLLILKRIVALSYISLSINLTRLLLGGVGSSKLWLFSTT
jgi:hypothetical protein